MKPDNILVAQPQVLVFRSNIDDERKAVLAGRALMKTAGIHRVNVDLEDWEKVLRVECNSVIQARNIEEQISRLGFECSELTH
jgi:hypothetical protein